MAVQGGEGVLGRVRADLGVGVGHQGGEEAGVAGVRCQAGPRIAGLLGIGQVRFAFINGLAVSRESRERRAGTARRTPATAGRLP
ncbi:hypothetical protein GCM10023334_102180 [Nonomuraea thailandensis]